MGSAIFAHLMTNFIQNKISNEKTNNFNINIFCIARSWWESAQKQYVKPKESKLKAKIRELDLNPGTVG